jgi:hypothetical protein
MAHLSVFAADPDPLDDLAQELVALVRDPNCPRGVLCALWLRLGVALSAREEPPLALRALLRLGVEAL